jgi:IS1 family transposase
LDATATASSDSAAINATKPTPKSMSVLLLEGMSIRSVERVTDIHRDTILRLLILASERCQRLMDEKIRGLHVRDVEVDEIWGYVFKKEAHKWKHEEGNQEIGDAYCFVAMERSSKLVLTHYLGKRTAESTDRFISRLALATSKIKYQLTSDGFGPYKPAVKSFLSKRVHFAQLVKVYASSTDGEQRYSPAEVVDAVPEVVMGNPDPDFICTSHIERQNLSIRMGMRRMTRLTNGFSKKWENLQAAYSLWFAYYNFCRKHQTLRVTPAMESGLTDHVWSIGELLASV